MVFQLHDIFTDHMILQRRTIIKVTGHTESRKKVFIIFDDKTVEGIADSDGFFSVSIGPFEASSEGKTLEAGLLDGDQKEKAVTITDILVGDVWFGCGQSNMEMGIRMAQNGVEEASRADHPKIRIFLLPKTSAPIPTEKLDGIWNVCTPQNIAEGGWEGFSALGYYFSVKLNSELNIPIGFIQSAFGGAWIHPFIRPDLLDGYASLASFYEEWIAAENEYKKNLDKPHPFTPFNEYNTHKAGCLYNAMVHPFRNFPVTGVLWYQGESNIGDGMIYCEKLEALVKSFRIVFHNPNLPFFMAQIAPWEYENPNDLPNFWEAQYKSAQEIKNSGLVVTADLGMITDIHPIFKKPVGERFADLALTKVYGKNSPWIFPAPNIVEKTNGQIILSFDADLELKSKDSKPLRWFELQDAEGRIALTTASLKNKKIWVDYDDSFVPSFVLYAWNGLVEDLNFYTDEDLPVRPFKIKI